MRLRPPAPISTVNRAAVGVEGVFDQFLHDAGGAFDHFAGGDLVGDLFGKQLDAVHRSLIHQRVEGLKRDVQRNCNFGLPL
jgi:hypothetical protein